MLAQKFLTEIKNEVRNFYESLVKSNEIILKALKDCNTQEFDAAKAYVNNATLKVDEIDNLRYWQRSMIQKISEERI
jgi:cellobiose-specific phosphotransferase system component IIA